MQFAVSVKIFCKFYKEYGENTDRCKHERNGRTLHKKTVSLFVFHVKEGINCGQRPAKRKRNEKKRRRCNSVGFESTLGNGDNADKNTAERFQKIGAPYGNA